MQVLNYCSVKECNILKIISEILTKNIPTQQPGWTLPDHTKFISVCELNYPTSSALGSLP